MSYQIKIPSCIFGGAGSIENVKAVIEKENAKKVIIFTDKGIRSTGLLDLLTDILEENKTEYQVFDDLACEPSYQDVEKVMKEVENTSGDLIIAIGGGSVMDAAKLCCVLKDADYTIKDLLNDPMLAKKQIKTVMIPTTCGTGSEATCNAIVAVPEEQSKKGIVNDSMIPDYVVLDSNMIRKLPKSIVAATGVKVIDAEDPTVVMKAVKNEVQLENLRKAHLKDAVAMCKFMYWLKTNIGKIPMTEISASDYLASLRAGQEGFLDLSFATICGYADHGAIVHYSATEESDRQLKPESLLLVDSGGHYLEGTTDITRTFALGPVTDEMKDMFTRVCRSNMNLANARFKEGCSGLNFDILAREPFWEIGMDYNHGTGHGVGYVLNVHEGPNSFHWKQYPGRTAERVIEEGMVTTDEPGIYLEGKFGIRTENELICRKGEKNEYGQFMYFENLTYVPIDLDAIDPNQMTDREKGYLNAYHARVYELVSPFLNDEEAQWLKKYTRAI